MTLVTGGGPIIPPSRVHDLDAVVVGAGGAGLYAALELKQDLGSKHARFTIEKRCGIRLDSVLAVLDQRIHAALPRQKTMSGLMKAHKGLLHLHEGVV